MKFRNRRDLDNPQWLEEDVRIKLFDLLPRVDVLLCFVYEIKMEIRIMTSCIQMFGCLH